MAQADYTKLAVIEVDGVCAGNPLMVNVLMNKQGITMGKRVICKLIVKISIGFVLLDFH
jgi:hypothetical protein